MKKLLGILVLGLFLITPSWGDEHDISLYKSIIKDIEGNYCGFLEYDSGHKFRIISTLKINEQDNIWGNYIFENYDREDDKEDFKGDGEVYKGVFFKGKVENTHKKFDPLNFKIKIFWIDDFGDGYLDINFHLGLRPHTFKGDWGFQGSSKHEGTWDGSRCEAESGKSLIR